MQGDLQGGSVERDKLGRYKPGYSSRRVKLERIAAKLEELRREFFPAGGESAIDASRLRLAARHYIIAETARDPTVSVRSTRTAEYLLNKLSRSSTPRSPATDHASAALELLNKLPDGV